MKALLLIDVQNDFCPGGSLAVPDGAAVVGPLNQAIEACGQAGVPVLASRDWHPVETSHFKAWGGVWPPHCVQGTAGASFHPQLQLPPNVVVFSKGMVKDTDSYSAFEAASGTGSDLAGWLQQHKIGKLFVGGLATDYCVKSSVLDGIKHGFQVYVLEDAVRGVELQPGDSQSALDAMRAAGAHIVSISAGLTLIRS